MPKGKLLWAGEGQEDGQEAQHGRRGHGSGRQCWEGRAVSKQAAGGRKGQAQSRSTLCHCPLPPPRSRPRAPQPPPSSREPGWHPHRAPGSEQKPQDPKAEKGAKDRQGTRARRGGQRPLGELCTAKVLGGAGGGAVPTTPLGQ